MDVTGLVDLTTSSLLLTFNNTGSAAIVFQVRSADPLHGPWTYTVSPGSSLADSIPLPATALAGYDISVFGPNGFFREFQGSIVPTANPNLDLSCTYEKARNGVYVNITNRATTALPLQLEKIYTKKTIAVTVPAGGSTTQGFWLTATTGWYDVLLTSTTAPGFSRRIAGHVENGHGYYSDPAIGYPTP